MATMTMSAAEGLQGRIREATTKVREREQDLEGTVHELHGAEDLLAQLRNERMQECIALAKGSPRAAPEKFDKQIQTTRDRIDGLENLKRRRENFVVECRVVLFELNEAQGKIETEKAIRAEAEELRQLVSKVEDSIVLRDRCQKEIGEAIHRLRTKKYLGEGNRHAGADGAQRLERISVGMRP